MEKQNEDWILAASENFEIALEANNYKLAEDIIKDTIDAGFAGAAQIFARRLAAAKEGLDFTLPKTN